MEREVLRLRAPHHHAPPPDPTAAAHDDCVGEPRGHICHDPARVRHPDHAARRRRRAVHAPGRDTQGGQGRDGRGRRGAAHHDVAHHLLRARRRRRPRQARTGPRVLQAVPQRARAQPRGGDPGLHRAAAVPPDTRRSRRARASAGEGIRVSAEAHCRNSLRGFDLRDSAAHAHAVISAKLVPAQAQSGNPSAAPERARTP